MNTQKKEENNNGEFSCDAKNQFVGVKEESQKEVFEVSKTAEEERVILDFWNDNNIFKKSINNREKDKEFVFYDGPPFATGLPHYGHLLAGTIKDVIPRYKTMKGFKVNRNWGWDCHGLPIENMIEKELNFNSKSDIEDFGIGKFNQKARESVLTYDEEWKKIVPKAGRWVDMNNPYKTMDSSYTESLWWAFSELNKKGLVKKDFKPMHICPRCETTLSNNEVTEGYKDIKDLSLTAKFELEDEKDTFVLAWTTTPWTLPGNVALAVGEDIDYIKVKNSENNDKYIFAKDLFEKIEKEAGFALEILEEFKGSDLVGEKYKPIFDYYLNSEKLKNKENAWKIYEADFVNTETGTGVVHIAPAFGEDDMKLGKEKELPFIQHVKMNGRFKKEVTDFAGLQVRKKDFSEEADIEIIKFLAHNGKLFSKEKFAHSYPHCWRCDTPLLNYATSSWFIDSPKIKKELLSENKKISWVPDYIGEKRFHNWLESTRPWAVSRSRYWGAPLPVFENKETGDYIILGSLEELKEKTKSNNKFLFLRHGESESNIKKIHSSTIGQFGDRLTANGKNQVLNIKKEIKDIDIIISSPFERTKQTAELISENVIFDDRLKEKDFGSKNGKGIDNIGIDENAETTLDVKKRVMEFLYEIDKKYNNKNILIIAHGIVGSIITGHKGSCDDIENAKVYNVNFAPIPHNENYELDFHRPFIDEISWEENGQKYEYIKEVFDCWFESGSMPFASKHYPFENKDTFNPKKGIGFPADFIAEGVDQTRGWFNTMLILSTALFGESSYKNVIVNGTILAEDGKKMSKSLKNYPDVNYILNKYGADALRLYLLSSPVVKAESLAFSEKGVDEILKKIIIKSKNIVAFFNIYKDDLKTERKAKDSPNILDKWILERTNKLVNDVSQGLDSYELDTATRPFIDYVDDLSTWYIRRSRDRFKGQDEDDRDFAISTTKEVVKILAKTIAPFAPFLAETLWLELKDKEDQESVHLENWHDSKKSFTDKILSKGNLLDLMKDAREIVSKGFEARVSAGIKVRQPLATMLVLGKYSKELAKSKEIIEIIEDELNIKEILFAKNKEEVLNSKNISEIFSEIPEKISDNILIILNKEINEELQQEGNFRELIRLIQTMRKKEGLSINDDIELKIELAESDRDFIEENKKELKRIAGVKNINYTKIENEEEIKINNIYLKLILIKI